MAERGAVLLCGGRSSRMGRPKAWLPWRGRPMAAHVVSVLQEVVDEVVVVRSAELDPPPLPAEARVVRDEWPAQGPLAGLATGLARARSELLFATSTDVPWLTPAFVEAVLAPGRAAAVVSGGFVQPLAAAYPRCAAPLARRQIEAGRRRPRDLLEALDYTPLAPEALPDPRALEGFNTPDEYLAAVAEDGATPAVRVELVGRPRALAGREGADAPPGTLGDVLARIPELDLVRDGRVAPPFLVSLGGRDFVRDAALPVGPGERVIVLDASAGG